MRKHALLWAIIGCTVTGCATYNQKRLQVQQQNALALVQEVCELANADHRLDPIRNQVPANVSAATLPQLNDARKATPQQRDAIESIGSAYAACYAQTDHYLDTFAGAAVATRYRELLQGLKQTEAALWGGEITFGDFNSVRAQLFQGFTKDAYSIQQRQQLAQQQMEIQRQQAAAAILGATYRPPSTTSCWGGLGAVTCNTR